MQAIYPLENPVMAYAWGSHTALADLFGQPQPSETPQAELWMGAHPKAPSIIAGHLPPITLLDLIAGDPQKMLGDQVCAAFDNQLPYLFKVLAAREPLSIQAHPSLVQARAGFARENRAGIPLDAPQRNYRDDNHKPELICALTPFWAMCGFRPPEQIARLLEKACGGTLAHFIDPLLSPTAQLPLRVFLEGLLTLPPGDRDEALEEAISYCLATREDASHWRWIPRLAKAYPGDIGALAPLFLNLVCLQPGEALFLPAGELHAYLEGTAIEIMANSDNVLRGGLTPKHVDLPELLEVLTFECHGLEVLTARPKMRGVAAYDAHCPEFQMYRVLPGQGQSPIELKVCGPEILLCTAGQMQLTAGDNEEALVMRNGRSVFIPAATDVYRLDGEGCLYRATVAQEME
jgi:mannose-6-phosphate isomerase